MTASAATGTLGGAQPKIWCVFKKINTLQWWSQKSEVSLSFMTYVQMTKCQGNPVFKFYINVSIGSEYCYM